MQIDRYNIAECHTGQPDIYLFRLTNETGAYVELTNWGARWVSAFVPDTDGLLANVLAGYDRVEDLLADPHYMGATVGRFANRIARAQFTINGVDYPLEANDGMNTNHGGFSGFHRKTWQWEKLPEGIRFSLFSPDGEGGYPANVQVTVDYHWSDDNELRIDFQGKADACTYLNLTNHAYFNLSGKRGTAGGHELLIPADHVLETDRTFIPTGKIVPVAGTPFDFRQAKAVGRDWHADCEQLCWNKGYNHCYVLKRERSAATVFAARLVEPQSKRQLEVYTDLPGILFYSAGYYSAPGTALCLETQYFPDSPSHSHFPDCLLRPGDTYRQYTTFRFGVAR